MKPPAASEPPKKASVDPGLNPQIVSDYVHSQVPKVRACYEWALKTNATLAGKIVMHWIINADGVPISVGIESNSMQPSPVPGCLQALIEEWQFPKPAGGNVEISFPFVFRSDNGAVEL